jgi:outer membrane murein-binding lipoprotein Lpp
MGLTVLVPVARAQEGGDLRKMYQDALAQLKESQDRKNQLASENTKLTAHVADLEKQLAAAKRQTAEYEQKTFSARAQFAAWAIFVQSYPDIWERWRQYIGNVAGEPKVMGDWDAGAE